jgi:hypothetical protein
MCFSCVCSQRQLREIVPRTRAHVAERRAEGSGEPVRRTEQAVSPEEGVGRSRQAALAERLGRLEGAVGSPERESRQFGDAKVAGERVL